jgi:hypothetical protein
MCVFLTLNCSQTQQKNMSKQEKEIIEQPNNQPDETKKEIDYDFVVSEAAVGNIKGVNFTVAGISEAEVEGKKQLTTYLDIEKSRFEEIYQGKVVNLNDKIKVLIIKMEGGDDEKGGKGKVYFKLVD